jgi:outer membrane lipoprotein SlyB
MRRAILFVLAAAVALGAGAVSNDSAPAESYLKVTAENSSSTILVEFAAMVRGRSLEMRSEETPFVIPVDTPTVGGWLFQKKSGAGRLTVRYVGTVEGERSGGVSGTGASLIFSIYQDEPRISVY